MLPILFSLGPITVTSYGALALVAFFGGAFLIWKKGREEHFEEEELFDVTLLATFWGLVGARAWFVAGHWHEFGLSPLKWVTLVRFPGLGAMGAVFLGIAAVTWWSWMKKWKTGSILDVMAIGAAFAQVWLFLGSFLNGSGYGIRTAWPIGVNFPGVEGARQPVQIYGLFFSLGLFWLTMKVFQKYRTYEWYKGTNGGLVASVFLAGFGLISLLTGLLKPLDRDLWWGVGWILVGVTLGYIRSERNLKDDINKLRLPKVKIKETIKRRKRKRGIVAGKDLV